MPSNLVWAEGKHNRIQKCCSCLFSYTGWWLSPTPLKNDAVKVSWDDLPFPTEWKVMKFHGSKPPTSHYYYINHLFPMVFPWFSHPPKHQPVIDWPLQSPMISPSHLVAWPGPRFHVDPASTQNLDQAVKSKANVYPLVNCHITMERSTIFNGKIHYFYGHFQKLCNKLPEGKFTS